MEAVILSIAACVIAGALGLAWGADRMMKHRHEQFRRLEKQNVALRAHLEVARARMRQLNDRRIR